MVTIEKMIEFIFSHYCEVEFQGRTVKCLQLRKSQVMSPVLVARNWDSYS